MDSPDAAAAAAGSSSGGDKAAAASCNWGALFADTLLDKQGGQQVPVPVQAALQGKHVALYFSAHWCVAAQSCAVCHAGCCCWSAVCWR